MIDISTMFFFLFFFFFFFNVLEQHLIRKLYIHRAQGSHYIGKDAIKSRKRKGSDQSAYSIRAVRLDSVGSQVSNAS